MIKEIIKIVTIFIMVVAIANAKPLDGQSAIDSSKIEDQTNIVIVNAPTIGNAVDIPYLPWSTGGSATWFGESTTYYYGGDAAQSGKILDNQNTWVRTTVTGPGTLTFYWKVSSESGFDYLEFYVDSTIKTKISGSVGWQKKTYSIGSGVHTIKWRYIKDSSDSSGKDAGWIDKVRFAQVYDNFNDNVINTAKWIAYKQGGPSVAETNSRLELKFPYYSSGGTSFGAGYRSKCKLRGDFDIQVDYNLLTWPIPNGVRTAIGSGIGSVERTSYTSADDLGEAETYAVNFGTPSGFVITDHMSGKLRMTRSGSTAAGYYYDGTWVKLDDATVSTSDIPFSLAAWSHDYAFEDMTTKMAFDNFIINYGQVVCS